MQPCSPVPRARPFWHVAGAWNGFGPAINTLRPRRLCRLHARRNGKSMTETTKNSGEKLSVSPTKTLTLKRGGVEQGVVRQSFSHGRSKAVVVEKVKRRVAGPGEAKADTATADSAAPAKRGLGNPKATTATTAPAPATPKPSGV